MLIATISEADAPLYWDDDTVVVAYRTHDVGDIVCPDCASNAEDVDGVDSDCVVLSEDEDHPQRCDHCSGRLIDS